MKFYSIFFLFFVVSFAVAAKPTTPPAKTTLKSNARTTSTRKTTTPSSKMTTKSTTKPVTTTVKAKSSLKPTLTTSSLKTTYKSTSRIPLTSTTNKKMTSLSKTSTIQTFTTSTRAETSTLSPQPVVQICRDQDVYSSSGKLQLTGNSTAILPTTCNIRIISAEEFMQISCSVVNLNSNEGILYITDIFDWDANPPVLNRIYYSFEFEISFYINIGKDDRFQCEWKPWNRPPNATDFKFCQSEGVIDPPTTGIIHPLDNLAEGEYRWCYFYISEPHYYYNRMQFSCSHVKLTNPKSYLVVFDSLDIDYVRVAVVNRTYVASAQAFDLISNFTYGDEFECKWEPYNPPKTNDFKSCHDGSATAANGTLQPFIDFLTVEPRWCDFNIRVSTNHSVQLSCSAVNLTTFGSFLQLRDWNGAVIAGPPIINQNYTSKNNLMVVAARFSYSDWFDCRWTTVPTPPVTQPEKPVTQVCHLDNETRSLNGTIQPYKKDLFGNNVRRCSFYIYAPVGRRVRMTCSVVRVNPSYNYTMGWTYLKFTEMNGASIALEPIKNEIYTSNGTTMVVKLSFDNSDWFDCNWLIDNN